MKLFLDANVLFTAAYSENGISHALFRLAERGHHALELCMSAYTIDEARRNLAVKAPAAVPVCERLLVQVVLVREPSPSLVARMTQLPLPAKDAPVMAAAVESGVAILVTGDRRDFGHLYGHTVEGVRVLSPADTLSLVL